MPYFVAEDGSAIDFKPHGSGWREVTKAQYVEARREYARKKLRELLKPKDTVTVVNVGGNNASRYRVLIPVLHDGKPMIRDVTAWAIEACGFQRARSGAWEIVMGGYGHSKPFEIVYSLGLAWLGRLAGRDAGAAWRAQRRAGQRWGLCLGAGAAVNAADPFTRASPQWRRAMALPHKSGPGLTIYRARRPWLGYAKVMCAGAIFWGLLLGGALFIWIR